MARRRRKPRKEAAPALDAPRRNLSTTWRAAGVVLLVGALLAGSWLGWRHWPSPPAPDAPATSALARFVGSAVCAGCHAPEHEAWRGSQHAQAMQEASAHAVLGDFDDASFRQGGIAHRFLRREGKFLVRTDGPDGKLGDFEIRYTFGVEPLQQYLIALPGGRLQALGIA